jgi:hypothetical protein
MKGKPPMKPPPFPGEEPAAYRKRCKRAAMIAKLCPPRKEDERLAAYWLRRRLTELHVTRLMEKRP